MEQAETAAADETGLVEDDNIDLPGETHDKETMTKLTSTPGTSHRSTTSVDHVQEAGTATGEDQHNTSDCKSCTYSASSLDCPAIWGRRDS